MAKYVRKDANIKDRNQNKAEKPESRVNGRQSHEGGGEVVN